MCDSAVDACMWRMCRIDSKVWSIRHRAVVHTLIRSEWRLHKCLRLGSSGVASHQALRDSHKTSCCAAAAVKIATLQPHSEDMQLDRDSSSY